MDFKCHIYLQGKFKSEKSKHNDPVHCLHIPPCELLNFHQYGAANPMISNTKETIVRTNPVNGKSGIPAISILYNSFSPVK